MKTTIAIATPMRTLAALLPVLLSALALALPAYSAASGPERAVEIVRETTDKLFEAVDQNRETFEQDVELLREQVSEIMLPGIDTLYAGRLVLGRSGRNLEREQVLEFAEALSTVLVRQYAEGVLEFKSRDQVEVLPLVGDNTERATRVRTRVTLTNGQIAPIDYVFRKHDGEWKIFDVIVEGISYVATFRNQVGEQMRREGFEATLASVRRGNIEVRLDD